MQQAARAYARTAQETLSGRDLEAHVLMLSARRLQRVREDFAVNGSQLDEALTNNRKLWTVLVTSVVSPENPLPREIKENIANLANFIFNRTIDIMVSRDPAQLDVLVQINRDIAAGLMTRQAAVAG